MILEGCLRPRATPRFTESGYHAARTARGSDSPFSRERASASARADRAIYDTNCRTARLVPVRGCVSRSWMPIVASRRPAPRPLRRRVTTVDFRCTGGGCARLFRVCNELSSVYFACIRIPQGKHAKRSIIVGTRNPHSWPVHLNSLFSSGARAPRRPPRPPTCNTHTHAVAVRAAPLDWHLSEPRSAHNAKP